MLISPQDTNRSLIPTLCILLKFRRRRPHHELICRTTPPPQRILLGEIVQYLMGGAMQLKLVEP